MHQLCITYLSVKATACKFVVKLCYDPARYGPENSNKWPLEFSHLSCQKCSKGFHHQSPHWSLCIHAKPTEKRIWQLDRSCPQTTPQGLKYEFDQAENVRRRASRERLLAGQSGNPASCEGKGRGRLVCTLQFADGSAFLSNVIQDSLATLQLETEVVAYILAGWLFMYSTCHEF